MYWYMVPLLSICVTIHNLYTSYNLYGYKEAVRAVYIHIYNIAYDNLLVACDLL